VNEVSGGTINCPCHGSKFKVSDGSVKDGPANRPLSQVGVKVSGSSIVLT
jgi:Rieske Fe-S protein